MIWRLEDLKRGLVGEHERESDSDCVEDLDLSSMRAERKERRYIQRAPGLDGDVGIMSRPPQHKHPFPPESRTRQRNPIQQSPEHVNKTYWRRAAAAATTYLIYPANH